MIPRVTLREALSDASLLGGRLGGDSRRPWRVLLIAGMGEALDDDERLLFKELTGGREREPGELVEELIAVIGRRGGKSSGISVLATHIAGLCEHPALVRGERGVLLIIAPDQKQADIVLDYITANFEGSPILKQLVDVRTARSLRLNNNVTIEVRASDFRNLRGPTFIAVIIDEVAFLLNENSANPDDEILNAVRPGLATTGGPLIMISSPYARRGELWRTYQKHFGPTGDPLILVAKGSSREFNPTLPQSVVDRAYERDPASADAEFGGNFRRDISGFVLPEAVHACVSAKVLERPPQRGISYFGCVDPSGGSSDSFSLAIGHVDHARQMVILDCLREITPPFSPEAATGELAKVLRSYHINRITGDRYAGDWPVEQFAKHNIFFEQSAKAKSDLYIDLLPLLNSCRVELLDHPKLIAQLCNLERRAGRSGRDSIDHPPNQHDDLCNALAGLCAINNLHGGYDALTLARNFNGTNCDDDFDGSRSWRAARLATYLYSGGTIDLNNPPRR